MGERRLIRSNIGLLPLDTTWIQSIRTDPMFAQRSVCFDRPIYGVSGALPMREQLKDFATMNLATSAIVAMYESETPNAQSGDH